MMDKKRGRENRAGWVKRETANHDAACCCDGCLDVSIIECEDSQYIASPTIHVRMAGMGFHGVKYALQEWVWV